MNLSNLFYGLILLLNSGAVLAQTNEPEYHIYAGNTHAHTSISASHGSHLKQTPGAGKYLFIDSNSVGHAINTQLKPDWQKYQARPGVHFNIAKQNKYDFYIVTDHSQEIELNPPNSSNKAWIETHSSAKNATDDTFVGLVGYEHSENDGPGAKGHINIINTKSYLNALKPGVDIKYLYKWLDTVSSFENGPVLGTFNHPGKNAFDSWAYRDDKITDILTMLEVVNSNDHIYYDSFLEALDAGWKVSPVSGIDNHGIVGIANQKSRTFVLATDKTKLGILEAMKSRRTYASLDQNLQCRYTVNGKIMGSTLPKSNSYQFDISIKNPEATDAKGKITKIDIVSNKGAIVKSFSPTPAADVRWSPVLKNTDANYFFVRVWTTDGGDVEKPKPSDPVAWLAPVWTSR